MYEQRLLFKRNNCIHVSRWKDIAVEWVSNKQVYKLYLLKEGNIKTIVVREQVKYVLFAFRKTLICNVNQIMLRIKAF